MMSKKKPIRVIDRYKFSIFLIVVYFLTTFKSGAQVLKDPLKKDFFMQFSTGYAKAAGKDVKIAFSAGTFIDANVGINLFHRKIYIQPELSFTILQNKTNISTVDQITFFRYGSSLTYFHALDSLKRIKIYGRAGFHYTTGLDKIFPRSGYTGEGIDIEKHRGMTYSAGAGFTLGGFFIEICYDYFRPSCEFNEELFESLNKYNEGLYEIYEIVPPEKLNLDLIRIKAGYILGIHL